MQHQKMECGFSLESHQQFFPTVQELDQCQLGCEHSHEARQKILQGHPVEENKVSICILSYVISHEI